MWQKVTGHFFVHALHAFHRFNRRYHVKKLLQKWRGLQMKDTFKRAQGKLTETFQHSQGSLSNRRDWMYVKTVKMVPHDIFTVCLHTFTLFQLTETPVSVETSQLFMCSFICVYHSEISSFFVYELSTLFLFFVICTSVLSFST